MCRFSCLIPPPLFGLFGERKVETMRLNFVFKHNAINILIFNYYCAQETAQWQEKKGENSRKWPGYTILYPNTRLLRIIFCSQIARHIGFFEKIPLKFYSEILLSIFGQPNTKLIRQIMQNRVKVRDKVLSTCTTLLRTLQ